MNKRLKKIVSLLKEKKIDALLVTNETNVRYLSAFDSHDAWMLVTPKKTYYITDFRYIYEAKSVLKGIQLVCLERSFGDTLFDIITGLKIKKIGYNPEHISVARFKAIRNAVQNAAKWVAVPPLVEQVRQIKERSEMDQIQKALAIHHDAHRYLKRIIRPGKREKDILRKLEQFVKDRDAGFSFDPIIASGPNSCYPHAKVTDRKIRVNEPVLVDMGIDVGGYKSDLTRMFFLGKIPTLVRDVESKVREAQRRAIQAIRPGVEIAFVDQQARNYLKEFKLDLYFKHALGHGVGLDIHEAPGISGKSKEVLQQHMVITIEPAVYLEGKFGIRIEDMVLVTNNGYKILSDNIH